MCLKLYSRLCCHLMLGPPSSGIFVAAFHNSDCVTVCDILRRTEPDKDAIATHVETEEKKDNPEDNSGESSQDTNDSMAFRDTSIREGVALENLESCSKGHVCRDMLGVVGGAELY